jgi:hypothetical protein
MRSLSMLRLAARAPCRSGPVTSTLGSTWGQASFTVLLAARHELTLANRAALGQAGSTLLPQVSPTRPAFRLRRAAIRPPTPAARRAHSLPPPARLANAARRCLTCRSTGRATARRPGREAPAVDLAPRGQGASPPRAGYLYVRPHVNACIGAGSMPSLIRRSSPRASVRPGSSGRHLSPCARLLLASPLQVVTIGRYAPASAICSSSRQQVSCGWRFAPACCAAQSVPGRAACDAAGSLDSFRAGGAVGPCPGKPTAAASFNSALARPLSIGLLFSCRHRKARPNMSVNRSLHGMPPWPRCARCPCCASRPGHHAVPARLPLR